MKDFSQDKRWKQRFNNYIRALRQLTLGIELSSKRNLNELEKQGFIKSFELVHELSWNLLKDYLEESGIQRIIGSKDAVRESFKANLITQGEVWMEMIQSRNLSSHSYDLETAEEIFEKIKNSYYQHFIDLEERFTSIDEKDHLN